MKIILYFQVMASPSSLDYLENKVQSCILDAWKRISLELCNYCNIGNIGKKHIEALLAHETDLSNVLKANIKDTELYKIDPDISLKLQCAIKKEISAEETAVSDTL